MENITKTFVIQKERLKTQEDVLVSLKNHIYGLSVLYFETIGEHGKFIQGNGHHMAQELAEYAEQMWKKRII